VIIIGLTSDNNSKNLVHEQHVNLHNSYSFTMAFNDPIVAVLFGMLLILVFFVALVYFLTKVVKVAWGNNPAASQVNPTQASGSQVAGDSKFCIKCGTKIPKSADFCSACGNKQS
jgi:ribosomal protein L40E